MQISSLYQKSITKRLVDLLFSPEWSVNFTDSKVGSFLNKIKLPFVSELLLFLSVVFFWYEGFFVKIMAIDSSLLGSVLLVSALIIADKKKIVLKKPQLYLICFYVLFLFSGFLAAIRGIDIRLIMLGWVLFAHFFVAMLAAQGVEKPIRLIKGIVFASIPMGIVGAYQYLTNQTTSRLWVSPTETNITTRAFAFFGSPNVLGIILSIIFIIALTLYIKEKNRVVIPVLLLTIMVIFFTFSRSAWLGLFIGLLVIFVVFKKKLICAAPLVFLLLLNDKIKTRLTVIFTGTYWFSSSLDGRLWAINNGLYLFEKYPLFGTGPGTYGGKLALNYASPIYLEGIQNGYVPLYFTDNQWLQLLIQSGFFCTVIFVLFILAMFYYLLVRYNKTKNVLNLGILGAFVSFLVAGVFGNVLEFGAIAVPMGIILGASFDE